MSTSLLIADKTRNLVCRSVPGTHSGRPVFFGPCPGPVPVFLHTSLPSTVLPGQTPYEDSHKSVPLFP